MLNFEFRKKTELQHSNHHAYNHHAFWLARLGSVHSSSQYTLGNIFFHYIKSYEMNSGSSVFNGSVGRVEDH